MYIRENTSKSVTRQTWTGAEQTGLWAPRTHIHKWKGKARRWGKRYAFGIKTFRGNLFFYSCLGRIDSPSTKHCLKSHVSTFIVSLHLHELVDVDSHVLYGYVGVREGIYLLCGRYIRNSSRLLLDPGKLVVTVNYTDDNSSSPDDHIQLKIVSDKINTSTCTTTFL